jgi:hypothetical protein
LKFIPARDKVKNAMGQINCEPAGPQVELGFISSLRHLRQKLPQKEAAIYPVATFFNYFIESSLGR